MKKYGYKLRVANSCFDKHGCNFDNVNKIGYSRAS